MLFTGISLPKAYLKKAWLSLTILLLPVMTSAWLISGVIIWGLIPSLTYAEALVIAACITPTDPVLAGTSILAALLSLADKEYSECCQGPIVRFISQFGTLLMCL